MIYIIGVDHLVQYKNNIVPVEVQNRFRDFLGDTVEKYGIRVLAEEFHREYLRDVFFSSEAVVESVAASLAVEHRFCDPGSSERERLGIPYYSEIRDRVLESRGLERTDLVHDPSVGRSVEDECRGIARSYWKRREEFWLEKLSDVIGSPILFVCGHEHVKGFEKILEGRGIRSLVVDPFWNREQFTDYQSMGI